MVRWVAVADAHLTPALSPLKGGEGVEGVITTSE
jgi:hypothetical protein